MNRKQTPEARKYEFTGVRFEITKVYEPKTFGQFVKAAREIRGLTIPELAEKAGLLRTTLIMLEKDGKDARISTVAKVMNALQFRFDLVDLAKEAGDEQE